MIHLTPAAPISEVGFVYVLLVRPDPEQAIVEAAARDSLGLARRQEALRERLQGVTNAE